MNKYEATRILDYEKERKKEEFEKHVEKMLQIFKNIFSDYAEQLMFEYIVCSGDHEILITRNKPSFLFFKPDLTVKVIGGMGFCDFVYYPFFSESLNPDNKVSVAKFILYAVKKLKL